MANLSKLANEVTKTGGNKPDQEAATTQLPFDAAWIEMLDMMYDDALEEDAYRADMRSKPLDFLFNGSNEPATSGGANQLALTAELTRLSTDFADLVLNKISSDQNLWADAVRKSFDSHDAMDALIDAAYPLEAKYAEFLHKAPKDDIEKMIRSQQSKRSRAKGKKQNMESFKTMLVGAYAENLLRLAINEPKKSGGSFSVDYTGYTPEQIEALRKDEDKLKKAIRNVQSKKSIESHKSGHDVNSARWKGLLAEEALLKSIRDNAPTPVVTPEAQAALDAQNKLKETYSDILNAEDLSPDDAKKLLAGLKEMLATN